MVAPLRLLRRSRALAAMVAALAACAALAPAARAADALYWGDITASKITTAGLDGTGAAALDTGSTFSLLPEGLVIDSARGRLLWAGSGDSTIDWVALDGSASGQLVTTGAVVNHPSALALDLAARRVYWANVDDRIEYASLDGGGGGPFNTGGATPSGVRAIAIDPAGGRLYWANYLAGSIASAKLDGSGDGRTFVTAPLGTLIPHGLAIDPVAGRLYWEDYMPAATIASARLDGTGDGRVLATTGATAAYPTGLAIDPIARRIYWANRTTATIASASLAGGDGRNLVATTAEGQFPIIHVAPRATAAPAVSGGTTVGATLSCSAATWASDVVAAFYFRAPQSVATQWTRDGADIPGATTGTITADVGGDYACRSTAVNHAGATSQTSAVHHVDAPARSGGGGGPDDRAFGSATRVSLALASAAIPARGPVTVRIANANPFAISAKLAARTTARIGGTVRAISSKAVTVAATGRTTVKLALPAVLRTQLAKRRKLALKLTAVVTDPKGTRRTVTRTVTVKLR